jgi:opacity protein-like surface antigen
MYKISKLTAGSVVALTAAVGGTSLALADGYAPKRVAYERPLDWSGVYFGVSSGYQWSSIDVTNADKKPTGFGITSDHNDALVGAHLGVQHQLGAIVLGVEGGWAASIRDTDGSSDLCFNHTAPATGTLPPGVVTGSPVLNPNPQFQSSTGALDVVKQNAACSARFNDVLTIGARIGWAAGHWMPYLTGGYANGAFDFYGRIPSTTSLTATTLVEQAHARLDGWYLGGGFEWAISPGWTAGIEYRHYDFGSAKATAFNTTGAGPSAVNPTGIPVGLPAETVRFDATTDTVTARVSWRWGRPEAAPLK